MRVLFLILATVCLLGCATTNSPSGGFIPDSYFDTKLTMVGDSSDRLTQDLLVEVFLYPFVDVVNFASLRFIWDHGEFPMSGFTHSFLDVFALIPGYSHTDIRFKHIFGLGDTSTEVYHEEKIYIQK